jgi:hypothetical protein
VVIGGVTEEGEEEDGRWRWRKAHRRPPEEVLADEMEEMMKMSSSTRM